VIHHRCIAIEIETRRKNVVRLATNRAEQGEHRNKREGGLSNHYFAR
jgi:hypothetical protein